MACLPKVCEKTPALEDIDEEECPRGAHATGGCPQSVPVTSCARRCSLQTSDYFSIGLGISPRQSISLSEEGDEAVPMEEVNAVLMAGDELSVDIASDAGSDNHCESNLQAIRGTLVKMPHMYMCSHHAGMHICMCACSGCVHVCACICACTLKCLQLCNADCQSISIYRSVWVLCPIV